MIKIAVCDDDKLYIDKNLKPLLSRAQKLADVYTDINFFTDGRLLLNEYQNYCGYNLVILDIDMPAINGKELAARLRELDRDLCIAFMSAYKEEVYDVISLDIGAFIPKEYGSNRCLDELVRLLKKLKAENPQQILFEIIENGKSAVARLSLDDIMYLQSARGRVEIVTQSERITLAERSLKRLEAKLSESGFYRIFSSIIVNVSKVYEVLETEAVLNDKTHLPVSRRRRKELLVRLSKIISARVVM